MKDSIGLKSRQIMRTIAVMGRDEMDDLISRQAAISAIKEWGLLDGLSEGQAIEILADEEKVPSAQPYTEEEIQAMQDLEQAQLDKAYQIGVEEGLQSAQPEQIARDIATIIENEQDMRVVLKNERTETHSCDYQHTETHDSRREWYMKGYRDAQRWIPVTEALPKNGHYYLKCTKYGNVDVDYYWDGFENATKYGEEIVAWMEKPKPYKEGQND